MGHGNAIPIESPERTDCEGERQEAFNALLWDLMTPVGLVLTLPERCDSC